MIRDNTVLDDPVHGAVAVVCGLQRLGESSLPGQASPQLRVVKAHLEQSEVRSRVVCALDMYFLSPPKYMFRNFLSQDPQRS